MIGRKSTQEIAKLAETIFSSADRVSGRRWIPWDPVYDFLYNNNFDAAICNTAERVAQNGPRAFVEFILKLHTGESVPVVGTLNDLAAREALGQVYLRDLAAALLRSVRTIEAGIHAKQKRQGLPKLPAQPSLCDTLLRSLELDGYVFRNSKLLHVDSALIDVEKQHSALVQLGKDLQLDNLNAILKFLQLSEDHYGAERWEDCIGNSRKFLEACLQECASAYSQRKLGASLSQAVYEKAVEVRKFLQANVLLSERETKAIAETYGALSQVGNHPKMASSDHARVFRQIALLYSEFVLLRTKEALK